MSRFVTQRGMNFIEAINKELVDSVVRIPVVIYRIDANSTTTNIYGEAPNKDFMNGTQLYALIEANPLQFQETEFGFNTNRTVTFGFRRKALEEVSLYPEPGDIIAWDDSYFEVDSVTDNSRFAGNTSFKVAILCETHMTRRDRLNIEPRIQ